MKIALGPSVAICLLAGVVAATSIVFSAEQSKAASPLSRTELDRVNSHFQQCWNVDPKADDIAVTVRFQMNKDGTVKPKSVQQKGQTGSDEARARAAFLSARLAIVRCGSRDVKLPLDKYDQWRNIELTFDPKRMRIK